MALYRVSGGMVSRELALETRQGNQITNCQTDWFSPLDQRWCEDLERDYPEEDRRSEPTSIYNCHGLTFASRRTAIDNSQEVLKILEDDKYVEVDNRLVKEGDVVLYFNRGNNEIEHSGIVVSSPDDDPFEGPRICSKLGKYREVIHSVYKCPYTLSDIRYYRIVR
jgi:hypothetical protein